MGCYLKYTDAGFVYAGRSYPGIPLLVNSDHVFVHDACDYFRHLVIRDGMQTSSVKTYAQYILNFWNFLENAKINYLEVTDLELLTWLNSQRARGNKNYFVQSRCDAVFDMFCWFQVTGRVLNMVRVPGRNDREEFQPALSSRDANGRKSMRSRYKIVSAIRGRAKDGKSLQPTPTSEDLTKLYVVADNASSPDISERNQLFIDWLSQTGVRRAELSGLDVNQIPDWSIIDRVRASAHVYELKLVKTKGGRPRHIGVLPSLLERTREWIEGGRAEIVQRFRSKSAGYSEPVEVFISNKTGLALKNAAISNLFTNFFREAHVEGHMHRIRAYYLTNLLQAEVDAVLAANAINGLKPPDIDWELIIRKVAERAGHQHLDSLRYYVTILKKKMHRSSGRNDVVLLDQMLRAKRLELELLERKIQAEKYKIAADVEEPRLD